MTKQTTIAIRDYTVTQADNARRAALNTVSALVLWTFHNPGEGADVLAGKTPKGFKAFKVALEAKGIDENRLRRVVTTGKKAAAMLAGVAGMEKDMDRKAFADHCARMVATFDDMTVRQAVEGENGLAAIIAERCADTVDGIKQAYAAATAQDDDAAPSQVEDTGETVLSEDTTETASARDLAERMAADAKAILTAGQVDKARAGDIAQVAQLVAAHDSSKARAHVIGEYAKSGGSDMVAAATAECDDMKTLQAWADLIATRMQELEANAATAAAA